MVNYVNLLQNENALILASDCKPVTLFLNMGAKISICFLIYLLLHAGQQISYTSGILDILTFYPLYYNSNLTFSYNKYFVI